MKLINWFKRFVKRILPIQIIIVLLSAFLVGQRDSYLQREKFLFEERSVLLKECAIFSNDVIPLVQNMTRGYSKYAVDVDISYPDNTPTTILLPPVGLDGDKIEETKWEIRKNQEPLRKMLEKQKQRRKSIYSLVQNYTDNEDIEIDWAVVDRALSLSLNEDRFVSDLWMKKAMFDNNIKTITEWNQYARSRQKERDQFVKDYPMPFRIYFYQDLITRYMKKTIELIIREQRGDSFPVKDWVSPFLPKKKIPAITEKEIVDKIYIELKLFGDKYHKNGKRVYL